MERKKSEEFVKKVYVIEIARTIYRRKGRPVVRWNDSVKECIHQRVADRRGGIELARWKCVDRE